MFVVNVPEGMRRYMIRLVLIFSPAANILSSISLNKVYFKKSTFNQEHIKALTLGVCNICGYLLVILLLSPLLLVPCP
jgi:hypothetical protein